MNLPYELQVGWRYTRAGRAGRRNGFISFISGVSMLGIALGVAALIIVLSVMNGFQKEVTDRMLSVIAHVEVFESQGNALGRLAQDRRAGAPFAPGDRRGAVHRFSSLDRTRRRHARCAGARHFAQRRSDRHRPGRAPEGHHAGAAGARRLGHRARGGAGTQPGRAGRRQGDDRRARAGRSRRPA